MVESSAIYSSEGFHVVNGESETYMASYSSGTNVTVTWEFESGVSKVGNEVMF